MYTLNRLIITILFLLIFSPAASANFNISDADTQSLFDKKTNFEFLTEDNGRNSSIYYIDTANSYKILDDDTMLSYIVYILRVYKNNDFFYATAEKVYYIHDKKKNIYFSSNIDYRHFLKDDFIYSPSSASALNNLKVLSHNDSFLARIIFAKMKETAARNNVNGGQPHRTYSPSKAVSAAYERDSRP